MLQRLTLDNFLLVDKAEVDFLPGMTVLTGETGAGKSIMINALSLVLGARGSADWIRKPGTRAIITAQFDIKHNQAICAKLSELAIEHDDELVLRRVLNRDAKSRALINDVPVTLATVKSLGFLLVDIYGQHSHQALGQASFQRNRLDEITNINPELAKLADKYNQRQELIRQKEDLQQAADTRAGRRELLSYQLAELEQLSLAEGEVGQLEKEEKQLAQAENTSQVMGKIYQQLAESEPALISSLQTISQEVTDLSASYEQITSASTLMKEAQILLQEATNEIRDFAYNIEINPERLEEMRTRLSIAYELARKHQCAPDVLTDIYQELKQQHAHLTQQDQDLHGINDKIERRQQELKKIADKISIKRKKAAIELALRLTDKIQSLGMQGAVFRVDLIPLADGMIKSFGQEQVKFMLEANPGQGFSPLGTSASGGELSRIGLAVQVCTRQNNALPVMIFDEVDAGIGGKTADTVGELLKILARHAQIICITHLSQVAVKADNHLKISKNIKDGQVYNSVQNIQGEPRVQEIARMLGGSNISKQTLIHAREMLEGSGLPS